jgi:hypothetical protein
MKLMNIAALAVLMAFGTVTAQEVEKKIELKIMVEDDGVEGEHAIHWSSDNADMNFAELEIGESQTITGESGREVVVTRTEEGMQFEVEGETIVMPDMGAHGTHMAFVGDGEHGDIEVKVMKMSGVDEDIDVRIIGDGTHMMQAHHPEGVTIVSGTELDDSVKESIKSVLISAGVNEEVTFIDGSQEGRQIRVIKKHVEITE